MLLGEGQQGLAIKSALARPSLRYAPACLLVGLKGEGLEKIKSLGLIKRIAAELAIAKEQREHGIDHQLIQAGTP